MANQLWFSFPTFKFNCDGVSNSFSLDLTDYIKIAGYLPRTPSGIKQIQIGASGMPTVTIVSATLNGAVLTVTIDLTPPIDQLITIIPSLYF